MSPSSAPCGPRAWWPRLRLPLALLLGFTCGGAVKIKAAAAASSPALKLITSFEDKNPFDGGRVTDQHAMLRIDGDMVEVEGEIRTTVRLSCSRCLAEFVSPLETAFALTYTRQRPAVEEPAESDAQEIDADQHIKAYQNEIRKKILDMYGFEAVPDEIEQYIQAASAEPAMEESAIFDAVVDVVVQENYDYYIYDLVPLGHALYYLSMAKVYDEWINKVTKLREDMREYEEMVSRLKREKQTEQDAILNELIYIKGRINASSKILTDKDKTAFFFVVTPEDMIIVDTEKAAKLFAQFDVPIGGYVVNRVIPHELIDQNIPDYLRNRIQMQDKYLGSIRTTFGKDVLAYVPELERDVTGLPMIEKLAGIMYGNGKLG